MKNEVFTVNGMKCNMCKSKVENALCALNGVSRAVASVENKNVEVEYDETLVGIETMKEAVDDTGFELEA